MIAEVMLAGLFGVAFYMIMDQWKMTKNPMVVMVKDKRTQDQDVVEGKDPKDPKLAYVEPEKKEKKDNKVQPKSSASRSDEQESY